MPGSSGEHLRTCAQDPNAAKLEKHREVYWLPCSATEPSNGIPLCTNPKSARLAVEAPSVSESDRDVTLVLLDENEEADVDVSVDAYKYHRLGGDA